MQRAALFSGGDAQMAAGDLGELLVPYMPTIRVPKSGDRVYKTECAFSYDSPVSAAKPPRAADPPSAGALRPTRPPTPQPLPRSPLRPLRRGQPVALSPRRCLPLGLHNSPSPSFASRPPHLPRRAPQPGLPSPPPRPGSSAPLAAGSYAVAALVRCSLIYFSPSGGLKWLLRHGGFAGFGELPRLLGSGWPRSARSAGALGFTSTLG